MQSGSERSPEERMVVQESRATRESFGGLGGGDEEDDRRLQSEGARGAERDDYEEEAETGRDYDKSPSVGSPARVPEGGRTYVIPPQRNSGEGSGLMRARSSSRRYKIVTADGEVQEAYAEEGSPSLEAASPSVDSPAGAGYRRYDFSPGRPRVLHAGSPSTFGTRSPVRTPGVSPLRALASPSAISGGNGNGSGSDSRASMNWIHRSPQRSIHMTRSPQFPDVSDQFPGAVNGRGGSKYCAAPGASRVIQQASLGGSSSAASSNRTNTTFGGPNSIPGVSATIQRETDPSRALVYKVELPGGLPTSSFRSNLNSKRNSTSSDEDGGLLQSPGAQSAPLGVVHTVERKFLDGRGGLSRISARGGAERGLSEAEERMLLAKQRLSAASPTTTPLNRLAGRGAGRNYPYQSIPHQVDDYDDEEDDRLARQQTAPMMRGRQVMTNAERSQDAGRPRSHSERFFESDGRGAEMTPREEYPSLVSAVLADLPADAPREIVRPSLSSQEGERRGGRRREDEDRRRGASRYSEDNTYGRDSRRNVSRERHGRRGESNRSTERSTSDWSVHRHHDRYGGDDADYRKRDGRYNSASAGPGQWGEVPMYRNGGSTNSETTATFRPSKYRRGKQRGRRRRSESIDTDDDETYYSATSADDTATPTAQSTQRATSNSQYDSRQSSYRPTGDWRPQVINHYDNLPPTDKRTPPHAAGSREAPVRSRSHDHKRPRDSPADSSASSASSVPQGGIKRSSRRIKTVPPGAPWGIPSSVGGEFVVAGPPVGGGIVEVARSEYAPSDISSSTTGVAQGGEPPLINYFPPNGRIASTKLVSAKEFLPGYGVMNRAATGPVTTGSSVAAGRPPRLPPSPATMSGHVINPAGNNEIGPFNGFQQQRRGTAPGISLPPEFKPTWTPGNAKPPPADNSPPRFPPPVPRPAAPAGAIRDVAQVEQTAQPAPAPLQHGAPSQQQFAQAANQPRALASLPSFGDRSVSPAPSASVFKAMSQDGFSAPLNGSSLRRPTESSYGGPSSSVSSPVARPPLHFKPPAAYREQQAAAAPPPRPNGAMVTPPPPGSVSYPRYRSGAAPPSMASNPQQQFINQYAAAAAAAAIANYSMPPPYQQQAGASNGNFVVPRIPSDIASMYKIQSDAAIALGLPPPPPPPFGMRPLSGNNHSHHDPRQAGTMNSGGLTSVGDSTNSHERRRRKHGHHRRTDERELEPTKLIASSGRRKRPKKHRPRSGEATLADGFGALPHQPRALVNSDFAVPAPPPLIRSIPGVPPHEAPGPAPPPGAPFIPASPNTSLNEFMAERRSTGYDDSQDFRTTRTGATRRTVGQSFYGPPVRPKSLGGASLMSTASESDLSFAAVLLTPRRNTAVSKLDDDAYDREYAERIAEAYERQPPKTKAKAVCC